MYLVHVVTHHGILASPITSWKGVSTWDVSDKGMPAKGNGRNGSIMYVAHSSLPINI